MGDKIYFGPGFKKVAVHHSEEGLAKFIKSAGAKAERTGTRGHRSIRSSQPVQRVDQGTN